MHIAVSDTGAIAPDRPWKDLSTIADVEQWIADYDLELQQHVSKASAAGCGICFTLDAGGEIYLHTNGDGDVVLDVTADAEWASPVICAAARVPVPVSQIWILPGDKLTQLVLGLNSLIATARIVTGHSFRARR